MFNGSNPFTIAKFCDKQLVLSTKTDQLKDEKITHFSQSTSILTFQIKKKTAGRNWSTILLWKWVGCWRGAPHSASGKGLLPQKMFWKLGCLEMYSSAFFTTVQLLTRASVEKRSKMSCFQCFTIWYSMFLTWLVTSVDIVPFTTTKSAVLFLLKF